MVVSLAEQIQTSTIPFISEVRKANVFIQSLLKVHKCCRGGHVVNIQYFLFVPTVTYLTASVDISTDKMVRPR